MSSAHHARTHSVSTCTDQDSSMSDGLVAAAVHTAPSRDVAARHTTHNEGGDIAPDRAQCQAMISHSWMTHGSQRSDNLGGVTNSVNAVMPIVHRDAATAFTEIVTPQELFTENAVPGFQRTPASAVGQDAPVVLSHLLESSLSDRSVVTLSRMPTPAHGARLPLNDDYLDSEADLVTADTSYPRFPSGTPPTGSTGGAETLFSVSGDGRDRRTPMQQGRDEVITVASRAVLPARVCPVTASTELTAVATSPRQMNSGRSIPPESPTEAWEKASLLYSTRRGTYHSSWNYSVSADGASVLSEQDREALCRAPYQRPLTPITPHRDLLSQHCRPLLSHLPLPGDMGTVRADEQGRASISPTSLTGSPPYRFTPRPAPRRQSATMDAEVNDTVIAPSARISPATPRRSSIASVNQIPVISRTREYLDSLVLPAALSYPTSPLGGSWPDVLSSPEAKRWDRSVTSAAPRRSVTRAPEEQGNESCVAEASSTNFHSVLSAPASVDSGSD